MEPRALCVLGKRSTIELTPSAQDFILFFFCKDIGDSCTTNEEQFGSILHIDCVLYVLEIPSTTFFLVLYSLNKDGMVFFNFLKITENLKNGIIVK
jgi:hypothetical protein